MEVIEADDGDVGEGSEVFFLFFFADSCDTLIFGHLREFCGVRLVR